MHIVYQQMLATNSFDVFHEKKQRNLNYGYLTLCVE